MRDTDLPNSAVAEGLHPQGTEEGLLVGRYQPANFLTNHFRQLPRALQSAR